MKYLFLLSHPAHFHLFKNFIYALLEKGISVKLLVRPKDVLVELMNSSGLHYTKVAFRPRRSGKLAMFFSLFNRILVVSIISLKYRPDFLIGSDATLAYVGKLLNIRSFEFSEDDEHVIPLYAKISYPLFSCIISPIICSAGKWEYKKVGYPGYHELAFLIKEYFTPDLKVIEKYDLKMPFCILRFTRLNAHHDQGITGIDEKYIREIISFLINKFNVYITSEKSVMSGLESLLLKIDPLDIHHIIAYSELLISDSQSMTMESAVLGTPSLRISSFSGKISVLEELEKIYELTYGIQPYEVDDKAMVIVEKIIAKGKFYYLKNRDRMLNEKIDLVSFMLWFFENFPESFKIMKENQKYIERFKVNSVT